MRRPLRQTRPLGRSPRRLLGGYGPLLALSTAYLLVVTLVPTIARQEVVVIAPSAEAGAPAAGTTVPAQARKSTAAAATARAPIAAGKARPGAGPAATAAAAAGAAGPCADRRVQVVGDPYSPPCIAWAKGKDNGGATSPGVTRDAVRISFRMPIEDISDYEGVIRQLTGDKGNAIPTPTEADVRRTIQDYITYFERNFQTYGRKIEMVEWKGKGSVINEIVGAGQEAAQADAIKAAKELKVFADVSAFTQPYNDALARQGVVAIGAPYLSRQWFAAHQPYSWSPFPDCTSLAQTIAEYLNKRVFGHPADHAGPGVLGKPRKIALVAPDNPEYQQCADAGEEIINAAGNKAARYNYTLDLATISDQANNLAAKLKQDGITTVVLATDPLLPLLLTSRMSQQNYYPEWVVTGTALTDLDVVGQFYDQAQWKHAFGLSMLGEQQPQGASFAYAAAKSVDPNHEPIFGAELIYYFCYMVATGIQMAGPDLTPQTFAAGMRAYPGGTGPAGTWGYPKGEYSPYRDSREIWWDPAAVSVFNNAPGRYASTNQRYKQGSWPTGPAAPQQLQIPAKATTPPEER
ncbi:MAG TPA: hypothetical protein VHV82_09690 [Sporichthyaceae bacterium]|jgi:hypothetical protein|nr:hypothetical protein [Sporichthyaceae bacterium]